MTRLARRNRTRRIKITKRMGWRWRYGVPWKPMGVWQSGVFAMDDRGSVSWTGETPRVFHRIHTPR